MRRSGLLLLCMLGGCDESSRAPVTGSPFNPVQFFTGHTAGEAKLSVISGATRRVTVDSMGSPDGHGGLTLNQKISEEGKASRARTWLLQPAGTNHWTGTLTDAKGPVEVERTRSDVTIRYRMKSGPRVEQHLRLLPDGTAENHMSITRFGIEVAILDERIRKLPQ